MFKFDISHSAADRELADETSLWLEMSEGAVHYKSVGRGPTIVLVHNSGMWGGIWDRWVPILAEKYHVVIPDLPGFGLTGPSAEGDYSYNTLANFLGEFVQRACQAPVHVVGLSLGGQLAWRSALLKPDLYKSLILINPTGYPEKALPAIFKVARGPMGWLLPYMGSKAMMAKNLGQLWGKREPVSDAFLDRLLISQRRAGNRAAFLKFLRTDNESLHEQIPQIQSPVQLQWSEKCGSESFSTDLSNVEKILFEDLGHLPNLEAPEETVQAAMNFIAKHERADADV